MMAFLFGVQSHIEADVIWHWGRNSNTTESQGFLQSMSHDGSDCSDVWNSGSNPTCHTLGDVGGDFYNTGRGGMAWHNETWTIPTDDLEQIYKSMNLPNETSQKIFECTLTMYLGSILQRHFAALITFHYDNHASFLTEELDLWYHGGLEDMGTNVAWKWEQLTEMFKTTNDTTSSTKKGKGPSCSVFGQGFLREKLQFYAELMGVTFTYDGHHEYTYDEATFKKNGLRLMNELFNDL